MEKSFPGGENKLIHGTYCGGWMWRRVSDLLEKQGHKVFSPTLTGLGERSHLLSRDIHLDTHITEVVYLVPADNFPAFKTGYNAP